MKCGFDITTKEEAEFLESWKKLELNLKQIGSLVDAKSYLKVDDKKNNEHLFIWLIQTSWHSWKYFIYARSTTEFKGFIEKWKIKEALPASYPLINHNQILTREDKLINQNKFVQKLRKISNNLFIKIFLLIAAIIVEIILCLVLFQAWVTANFEQRITLLFLIVLVTISSIAFSKWRD